MLLKHFLPGVACVAILAGCATTETPSAAKPTQPIAAVMAEAEVAFAAGAADKGVAILKKATVTHPGSNEPWTRLAQLSFEKKDYADAITSAEKALAINADDMHAHSIAAVGGLRVSLKALNDLAQKNNLSGTVRSDAQELAKLLRARLGEEAITGIKQGPKQPVKSKGPLVAEKEKEKKSKSDDSSPFSGF